MFVLSFSGTPRICTVMTCKYNRCLYRTELVLFLGALFTCESIGGQRQHEAASGFGRASSPSTGDWRVFFPPQIHRIDRACHWGFPDQMDDFGLGQSIFHRSCRQMNASGSNFWAPSQHSNQVDTRSIYPCHVYYCLLYTSPSPRDA